MVISTNRGKGKFHEVFLELIRGKCTMKAGGRQGEVLREATVIGATAALLKNARKGHEDCREAGRPCIRCLSPASTCRGVFGRSLRAAANCAELCGAGKCDYCCGSATRL